MDWSGAPSISARRIQALRQRTWQLEALKEGPCDWGMVGASVVGLTEGNPGDLAEEFAWATGLLSRVDTAGITGGGALGSTLSFPLADISPVIPRTLEMWVVASESARPSTKVLKVHG